MGLLAARFSVKCRSIGRQAKIRGAVQQPLANPLRKVECPLFFGLYNFSSPADIENGENLLLIRDRRIAVSYTIEALRLFDHYHFRVIQEEAKKVKKKLTLAKPPRNPGEVPWWAEHFTNPRKILDRKLFA